MRGTSTCSRRSLSGAIPCTSRNHRLAALHAFFRYVQAEEPARMHQCQNILAIPLRKHARPTVGYLSKEELAAILAQPDLRTPQGRRDAEIWLCQDRGQLFFGKVADEIGRAHV